MNRFALPALAAAAAIAVLSPLPLRAEALQGGQATAAVLGGAPLMGTGEVRALHQFTRDEADRLAMAGDAAARDYGLPLGLDDHGSTPATAAPLGGSVEGVVETPGDRDVFVVHAGRGALAARLVTAAPDGAGELVLVLRDAAGGVLAAASPGARPGPVLAYDVPEAGTFYLDVAAPAGAAAGGHYRLSASHAPAAVQPLALRADPAN